MKKLRPKNLTMFLVVLFTIVVLTGSFTLYCSNAFAAYCTGSSMDCSQACEQGGWELVESTSALDTGQCSYPKTLKEVGTGSCGEYWDYTRMSGGKPLCEEYHCDSDYARTTSNCVDPN